jgi:hypothetical protein
MPRKQCKRGLLTHLFPCFRIAILPARNRLREDIDAAKTIR